VPIHFTIFIAQPRSLPLPWTRSLTQERDESLCHTSKVDPIRFLPRRVEGVGFEDSDVSEAGFVQKVDDFFDFVGALGVGFGELLVADPELHVHLDDASSGVVVASPAVADFAGFAHILLVEHLLLKGVGEVEVEDERSARRQVGGDPLERPEQVLGVGDVVEAIEEAEGGIVLAAHVNGAGVGDFES